MVISLRLVITVLPVLFIGAAFLVMKKKATIDETEYARMLEEIEARKHEGDAE